MSSVVFDAYTGFLTAVQTALPTVTVYDGPQPVLPTDQDFILVGVSDPLNEGPKLSVDNGVQSWAAMMSNANRPADETFDIFSTIITWTGANDLADCRSRAQAHYSAINTQVRSDLTLGGKLSGPGWVRGLSVVRMQQGSDTDGVSVHVLIQLGCYARV